MVMTRATNLQVTFAGVILSDVLSARGEVSVNGGWPSCSVFVTAKPTTGNEEDGIQVIGGAGNNVVRFQGRVRRFRPSGFPKSVELVASGTLAYAGEWAPAHDFRFGFDTDFPDGSVGVFPDGATDQDIVQWVLDQVPNVTYVPGNIGGTGIVLATTAPNAFDWKKGTSAWSYIQQLDRATLYRTYQTHDGAIWRVKMIGHPNNTPDFTLTDADVLDGSTATRETERTKNAVEVNGHDYGKGAPLTMGTSYGTNDFQGDGSDPASRHEETFQSSMIESGYDPLGGHWTLGGIDAQDIADEIINDVNKEFVEASVQSWHDDLHGPGLTCLLDTLDRLAVGEPMWVQKYAWEVGDSGWMNSYQLTGGGLPQDYTPPPV
jgi:hypothetical protein